MAKIHTLISADSRGVPFLQMPRRNEHVYNSLIIASRGAQIARVKTETIHLIESLPKSDLILVRIACGINNFTQKEVHSGGIEISYRGADPQKIILELLEFKDSIRIIHPKSLVSFATIPIVDFAKAQGYNIERGKLCVAKYSDSELQKFQGDLSDNLSIVNKRLILENKNLQYIPEWGVTRCTQQFWHQEIEKIAIRKKGENKIKVKRIPTTALPDGIHVSDKILKGWYDRTHECFMKDILAIKRAPMTPP